MSVRTSAVLCPICSVTGPERTVRAPMISTHVTIAPAGGHEHAPPPYFAYRCPKCGFGEIHPRDITAA